MKKIIYTLVIVVFIIVCIILTYRFTLYNESYKSLDEAVEKTTNGSIESSYTYKNGYFTFIKDSKTRTLGYYYKEKNKWYLDKYCQMTNNELTEKYIITTYYYKNLNITFIEVKSLDKKITYISDSLNTEYSLMKHKDQEVSVGVHEGTITKDYKLKINNKKYKVKTTKKVYRGEDYIYVEDE